MEELRQLNNDTYEWEYLMKKLVPARDKPILTCLEYIREYLMKKIVNVQKNVEKASGSLTPTATKNLEKMKQDATHLRAIFCRNRKFQVSGQNLEQFVVDMGQQTCACKKWEITGMPCKHAIAAIWEMRKNSEDERIPEAWVHRTYWLETWKEMYSFTIDPINGRNLWEKSACPTSLLPPNFHVPIGRPKKKRRKSAVEIESLVKGQRVSREHKTVTCSKCHTSGYNARGCKSQNASQNVGQNAGQTKKKGGGPKKKAGGQTAAVGRPKRKAAPAGRPKKKAAGVNNEK